MILRSNLWWCRRGASHRKKGGHVTPNLGTAEREKADSMFTQVNVRGVNRLGQSLDERGI